jgi:23S rRNA (cytosine1962-C5)-methyltransferase
MTFFTPPPTPIHLILNHDLRWALQSGFPWIYAPAITIPPHARTGDFALLKDGKGTILAKGFCDPQSHLAFRVLSVDKPPFNDETVMDRLRRAEELRRAIIPADTTAFRLVNGEGDYLPGLVIDQYGSTAVIKTDGAGPAAFWNAEAIASWLIKHRSIDTVYLRNRESNKKEPARLLVGSPTSPEVTILEREHRFIVNVVTGQKTGFFIDQRENREMVGRLSPGRRVLNLFGYTGGFSIYAGRSGAHSVDTVDIAAPAIALAERNWALNDLPPSLHNGHVADVFDFLAHAKESRQQWDLIVVDPPSFVHQSAQVEAALAAYERLFTAAIFVAAPHAIIAFASCSSKITIPAFETTIRRSISHARRRARTLAINTQPPDHPYPLACEDLQYLRFVVVEVE